MDLLPHIDIIEPERIAALLADERNFCWRAVDSEGLDGWTPDLGISGYPRPSIVRPASVAAAGVPSTLRHRFWQTVQSQADHTGKRYIGVVIYLAAGEPSPLILRLRGEDIGRIEPTRLDNRLHLLVADVPVDFIGEMEIFNIIAPGKGSYRIEHVLLLKERPAPSSFAPEIQNVAMRKSYHKDICYFNLHVLTSCVCDLTVNFQVNIDYPEDAFDYDETSGPSRMHNIFTELGDDDRIVATITAYEASGASATQVVEFSTKRPEPARNRRSHRSGGAN